MFDYSTSTVCNRNSAIQIGTKTIFDGNLGTYRKMSPSLLFLSSVQYTDSTLAVHGKMYRTPHIRTSSNRRWWTRDEIPPQPQFQCTWYCSLWCVLLAKLQRSPFETTETILYPLRERSRSVIPGIRNAAVTHETKYCSTM